jgi:hypothetical protein
MARNVNMDGRIYGTVRLHQGHGITTDQGSALAAVFIP